MWSVKKLKGAAGLAVLLAHEEHRDERREQRAEGGGAGRASAGSRSPKRAVCQPGRGFWSKTTKLLDRAVAGRRTEAAGGGTSE